MAGQAENVFDSAIQHFQLDFTNGRAFALAFDIATVDGQFDPRFAKGDVPDLPTKIGSEDRFERAARCFKKIAQVAGVNVTKVEHAGRRFCFPFAAHGQTAAGWFG